LICSFIPEIIGIESLTNKLSNNIALVNTYSGDHIAVQSPFVAAGTGGGPGGRGGWVADSVLSDILDALAEGESQ